MCRSRSRISRGNRCSSSRIGKHYSRSNYARKTSGTFTAGRTIITNAVIHRDYSIADDIHIRIFDNRIEVQSPGRLPGHVTPRNILEERSARNGTIVRLLNKFPDPPNQDVGEGLNTAFEKMHQLGLKEPTIEERDNDVLVTIRHELLASPEEAILKYLETNETIKNKTAREITHIKEDYRMKRILSAMADCRFSEARHPVSPSFSKPFPPLT